MIEPYVAALLDTIIPFLPKDPGTFGIDTPLPRTTIWSSTSVTLPAPGVFQPKFFAVLKGVKVLSIGDNHFSLGAGDCAASSFGLPYLGHLAQASLTSPFIAVSLDLDIELLNGVLLDMPKSSSGWTCPAAGGRLEGALGGVFVRLIGLLATPDDAGILWKPYERELYYRLLQGPMGDTLRQVGRHDHRLRQIKTAADWLSLHPDEPVVISELAATVGMSPTSFYRHFKAVTGYSPLAFQRHLRLLEARRLLVVGTNNVSTVALTVGYASPAQFSREYKAMFGVPPTADQRSSDRMARH